MATSSTGTISSAGIGSGLDVDSIVNALVEVKKQRLYQLEAKEETIQTKLSAFGQIKSHVSSLYDAAAKLARPSTWSQTTATSGNEAVFTASSDDSNAAVGSYSVVVERLATSQSVYSKKFTNGETTVGSGSLSIQLADGSDPVSVTVASTDTLEDIRDKINQADAGVNASVVTDGGQARLVLRSSDTGAEKAFTVTATDDDGNNTDANGLSALAYNTSATGSMTLSQTAVDAKYSVDGLSLTSASNTVTGAIEGVTLKLTGVSASTSTPTALTLTQDTEGIKEAITAFVEAYNEAASYLATAVKYDADSDTAGDLQGDSTANSVRQQLRSIISGTSGASSVFTHLSQVGFDIQKDGTIKLEDSKLSEALENNAAEMKKLFANTDADDEENNGFAVAMRKLTLKMTGSTGALTTKTTSLKDRISDLDKQQERQEYMVELYKAQLQKTYTKLDETMGQMSGLSGYVSQQLAALNNSGS